MKYFLDTEFHDHNGKIDLISLALFREDGKEFCLTSSEFDFEAAHAVLWLRENVLAQLPPREIWVTRQELARQMTEFVGQDRKPEFWAWFGAYDWVATCQLFGGMLHLPKNWPQNVMDLKQEHALAGSPRLPRQMSGQHDALEDARGNREVHNFLMKG